MTTADAPTPGTWDLVAITDGPGRFSGQIVAGGRGVLLIEHDGSAEGRANARLATSAAALLAALDDMTRLAEGPAGGVTVAMKREVLVKARMAIGKAKDVD
jgi:hypothetical protein